MSITTPDNGSVVFVNKVAVVTGNILDSLLVFKLDATGMVVWSHSFAEYTPEMVINFINGATLPNGSLLFTGRSQYTGNNSGPDYSSLLLLDAGGNLLWQKTYTNLNLTVAGPGAGGELLAAGWGGSQLLVTRLSGNGDIIWSNTYTHPLLLMAVPDGLFNANGRIYIGGDYTNSSFQDYSVGFWLEKLDYATGQLLEGNSWKIAMSDIPCQLTLSPVTTATGLPDAQCLFAGAMINSSACVNGERFFARVDSSLRLIPNGIRSFSFGQGNLSGENVAINAITGEVSISADYTGPAATANYAILDKELNIETQRTITGSNPTAIPIFSFNGYNLSGAQGAIQANNASYTFIRTDPSFIAGGSCIGFASNWLTNRPITATTSNLTFTSGGPNPVIQGSFTPAQQTISIGTNTLCEQQSICDSLHIHGDTSFCPGDQTAAFTASKSITCLKQNTWQIDTTAWTILDQPNDTTIHLAFDQPWEGYIYATIAGCGLKDSLHVTIHGPIPPADLGPDKVLCPGTTIVLQPKGDFLQYEWQDGSTTDHYLAVDTGLYWVKVTDFCGNGSADSVEIRDCRKIVYFPNAFTPNHDGANDYFRPLVNGEIKEFVMSVYDRWGQLIFTSADPSRGWNGSFNGRSLPPGVYVWFCRYQFAGDSPKQGKGTVILIR